MDMLRWMIVNIMTWLGPKHEAFNRLKPVSMLAIATSIWPTSISIGVLCCFIEGIVFAFDHLFPKFFGHVNFPDANVSTQILIGVLMLLACAAAVWKPIWMGLFATLLFCVFALYISAHPFISPFGIVVWSWLAYKAIRDTAEIGLFKARFILDRKSDGKV